MSTPQRSVAEASKKFKYPDLPEEKRREQKSLPPSPFELEFILIEAKIDNEALQERFLWTSRVCVRGVLKHLRDTPQQRTFALPLNQGEPGNLLPFYIKTDGKGFRQIFKRHYNWHVEQYEQKLEAAKRDQAKVGRDIAKAERNIKRKEKDIEEKENSLVPIDEKINISNRNLKKYQSRIAEISKRAWKHQATVMFRVNRSETAQRLAVMVVLIALDCAAATGGFS